MSPKNTRPKSVHLLGANEIFLPLLFKVNDAEKDKIDSAKEHKAKSEAYRISEVRVQKLHKSLKRSIAKSR